MKSGTSHRPFVLAFAAFVFLLGLTMATSLYTRNFLITWSEKSVEEVIENVISMTDTRFNSWRLRQYGLMEMLRGVYRENPDLLAEIHKNGKTADMYGNINEVVVTNDADKYPSARTALAENRPVFFTTRGADGSLYFGTITPIDSSTGLFVYTSMDFSDLFLLVNKTKLLDGICHLGMKVFAAEDSEKPVYVSEDFQADSAVKRSDYKPNIVKKVAMDTIKMEYRFTELKSSQLSIMVRHVPFTIVVIGTVISVLAFGAIYMGAIYYEKDITVNSSFKKE